MSLQKYLICRTLIRFLLLALSGILYRFGFRFLGVTRRKTMAVRAGR